MKIAVCILVHSDPVQLNRLIHALDDPRFDCYVHIDSKADLNSFHFEDYALQHSKLIILEDRINCLWGDITLVEAEFSLYRKALQTERYDHFITLSGSDYPIQTNDEICRRLESANTEFIACTPLKENHQHRVTHFFVWKAKNQVLFCFLKKILKILRIYKKTFISIDRQKWDVYVSSQWHALTHSCVCHILQQYDQHPQIKSYFRHSYAPDELIIPTIICNSQEFRHHATIFSLDKSPSFDDLASTHYLKYFPNSMGTVKVLTEEDFPSIVVSGKLFARKLITGRSDNLIEQISKFRTC